MANHATKNTSPEEVIAIIRKHTEKLGYVPSLNELLRLSKMHKSLVRRYFGSYVKALEACGLERHGCGYRVEMLDLFLDWAGIVRQLGKVPSMLEYQLRAKYSTKPLATRYGGWKYVLPGLIAYANEARLEDE